MKKLLINLQNEDGCTFHRLLVPYSYLVDNFDITWGVPKDIEDVVAYINSFDVFIFHRVFPIELLKQITITKIIDMDDYWELGSFHPAYNHYLNYNIPDRIKECMKLSDWVTCTTPLLAEKIKPFNPNVVIFPNSLPPVQQNPKTSNRIRLGLMGGSSHLPDVSLLEGMVNQLPKDVLDKIQIVLCGFDKGVVRKPQLDGTVKTEPMAWEDNGWVKMERILTDNYRIISPEHKKLLQEFNYGIEYDFDEPYKRIWGKDIYSYLSCYDDIDILLVPLVDNDFNHYKSELKMIEAASLGKPVIASDVYPYKLCAISAVYKGGEINPDGNCLLVNNQKGSRGWVKAITKLVNNPNLQNLIKGNLPKLIEGKYNLQEITEYRKEFLNKL